MNCIFCDGAGPFTTREHIIPESLGNDDLIITGIVCDSCQKYFGKEVEQFVLSKTPFAFWKVFYGIKSKKGVVAPIDLSLPSKQKGRLPSTHNAGEKGIVFASEEEELAVEIDDPVVIRAILDGSKSDFRFVLTPLILVQIGRFLGKIAIELIYSSRSPEENTSSLSELAKYARYGTTDEIWPILCGTLTSKLSDWTKTLDPELEERTIYRYSLFEISDLYVFFFDIGYERWGIILNQKFPHPLVNQVLKNEDCTDIKFLWYGKKALRK